eukprot:5242187-Prorocentrum_lima.AAC.1
MEVQQLGDWLDRVGGVACTPSVPTCNVGAGSIIDFICLSKGLAPLAQHHQVQTLAPLKPHSPVALQLARAKS